MPAILAKKSSPPSLREIQSQLAQLFTDPRGPRNLVSAELASLKTFLIHQNEEDFCDRTGIYSDAYYLRLKGILEADFSASRRWIGDDSFLGLVQGYLRAHPPGGFNAVAVGRKFPHYVATQKELEVDAAFASLVALEWELIESLFSPYRENEIALGCAELRDPDNLAELRFECDPSVRWVTQELAIEDFWQALRDGESPEAQTLRVCPERPHLLLRRESRHHCGFYRLSDTERALFEGLSARRSLGELCEDLTERADLGTALGQLGVWAMAGLLKKVFKLPAMDAGSI